MAGLQYPCWRYHRTDGKRLCATPEAELALGPGWADTPAAFLEPAPVSDVPLEDLLRDTVPAASDPVPDLVAIAGAGVRLSELEPTPAPAARLVKRKR